MGCVVRVRTVANTIVHDHKLAVIPEIRKTVNVQIGGLTEYLGCSYETYTFSDIPRNGLSRFFSGKGWADIFNPVNQVWQKDNNRQYGFSSVDQF